jgi:DNA-binding MarR family transcriptional regulator
MDLIVAVCRTLASRPRLRLLRAIYAQPAITVNELAEAVQAAPAFVSHHLKLLSGLHFIQAVPSGRYVHYRPAEAGHLSNPFLRAMHTWLQGTLAPRAEPAMDWKVQADAMVTLFTTYTHLRRLLILRHLARNGACTPVALMAEVGMSAAATNRHLDKLLRRGIVNPSGTVPRTWRLATLEAPAPGRCLWTIIRRELTP